MRELQSRMGATLLAAAVATKGLVTNAIAPAELMRMFLRIVQGSFARPSGAVGVC